MEVVANNKIHRKPAAKKKIAIVTCCLDDWGGSEELWWKAAIYLQEQGIDVMILKAKINSNHPKFIELSERGILLRELDSLRNRSLAEKLFIKTWNKLRSSYPNYSKLILEKHLKNFQPDHVLISQGINFDGLMYADCCRLLPVSFSIVSHKAVEFYWPQSYERELMKTAFQKAEKCFFVSKHNQQLTEEQFGFRFQNAQVVRNPVTFKKGIVSYPHHKNGFKLACIGRLFIIDKGQDILLRVLAQQKWKERPLTVSFIGTGADEAGLKEMAALLNVSNVEFRGHVDNVEELWKEYHALVLPSRSEGLPLVILEAMAAGRMVITTNAGGNKEIIQEEKTGFIGEVNFSSFDAVLDKAWQHREGWEEMGRNAFQYAIDHIPETPEIDFANTLTKLIYE